LLRRARPLPGIGVFAGRVAVAAGSRAQGSGSCVLTASPGQCSLTREVSRRAWVDGVPATVPLSHRSGCHSVYQLAFG